MTATGMSFRFGRAQHDHTVRLQRLPLSSMPVEYLTPAIEDGAVEALALLAGRGQHRAPSIPFLIIAATAELTGITVRHVTRTSRSSPRSRP